MTQTASADGLRAIGVRHPLWLVAIGVVLFSTGPVMISGSETTGPILIFWRLWIGAALFGTIYAVQFRAIRGNLSRLGWAWSAGSGIALGVHQLFFATAIKRTSVIDVTLMQLLAPVIVAVLATAMFGEHPGAAFRIWSVVSMVGGVVVTLAGSSGPEGDPLGVGLAVANVVFFAAYFVGAKKARGYTDTITFLFGSLFSAAVVVSAYNALAGEAVGSVTRNDLIAASAIALVPGGLGHFVSTWPLHRVAANIPPIMQLTMPFLSGILAWLLLDETVGAFHVLGGVITLGGVLGALRSSAGRIVMVGEPSVLSP